MAKDQNTQTGADPDQSAAPARDRLLKAAARLFAEKGFGSVSVREICKAAGTSINMVHHYFGSKDGLLEAVEDRFIEEIYAVPLRLLATPARSAEDLSARVILLLETTLEACLAERDVLLVVLREESLLPPLVTFQQSFVGFMERAQKDGFIRADLDAPMLSGLILDRCVNQARFAPWMKKMDVVDVYEDADYRRTWCQANADLFLNGILAN